MKLCIIGTGYVGLVTGSCFADMGNDVICVDKDKAKIDALKKGELGIYEPGLSDLVSRNYSRGRLIFTTNLEEGVKNSLICFIAVGTPENEDGSADLKHVLDVAGAIGRVMDGYRIIVDKSTVPVGTADLVAQVIKKETNNEFDVVSNPEFLKEGAAVDDFMKPERIIIGTDDVRVAEIMKELYAPFIRTGNPMYIMDVKSAELTKYASNAFLATKISFMNEIANLCDRLGANVEHVRKGMGSDSRIGPKFLFPGVGFGGSCFPKDLSAIIKTSEEAGSPLRIAKSVMDVNRAQREVFIEKISSHFEGKIEALTIAVWGLSFKPQTDDIREAPSIIIAERLLESGAKLRVFDPAAMDNFKEIFGKKVYFAKDAYDAVSDSDAMVLVTEWNEFRNPDFPRIKKLMKSPVIFDGRNQYNRDEIERIGFTYYCIGRPGRKG
ncbi:MAG: UDP-glucose/GDP-mannose dehydrogenase family protein [Deltaproteobacteria bacterium]|uniref:UDP-glucose 6-dehydrogenase n=1 Tax=Candidatus Zymogenus saltonus TaxID=2844893 RepID=A0A9D8KEC6_9DELT|nr:UDP-glucose/GDP-mannose dehydrogenase family protein [Candidatus Zymogenus saltonus]